MIEFMRAGGVPIWIVLLFGLITLAAAGSFFWRPDQRKKGLIQGMSMASVFSILAGILSCLAAVMSKVPNHPEWSKSPDLHLIVMTGIGESLTPGILGFAILSLAWLFTALGTRKMAKLD